MPSEPRKKGRGVPKRAQTHKVKYLRQWARTRANTLRALEKHIAANPNDKVAKAAHRKILATATETRLRGICREAVAAVLQ